MRSVTSDHYLRVRVRPAHDAARRVLRSSLGRAGPARHDGADGVGDLHRRHHLDTALDLLGRDGDQAGIAYWSTLLETGTSRAATSAALVASNEYRSDVITGMYEQFLERGTDPGGLAFWVGQVGRGMTFEQFQSQLMGSDEYFHMPTKGNGDNDTFVKVIIGSDEFFSST